MGKAAPALDVVGLWMFFVGILDAVNTTLASGFMSRDSGSWLIRVNIQRKSQVAVKIEVQEKTNHIIILYSRVLWEHITVRQCHEDRRAMGIAPLASWYLQLLPPIPLL